MQGTWKEINDGRSREDGLVGTNKWHVLDVHQGSVVTSDDLAYTASTSGFQ